MSKLSSFFSIYKVFLSTLYIMSSDRYDAFMVRFNGKNNSAWAFHFKFIVKGKDMWGYVNGTLSPSNKDKEKDQYAKWEIEDAQVQSRILGSVEPHIILNLRTYQIATNMWTYLKKHYSQNHIARRFQLEFELSNLT